MTLLSIPFFFCLSAEPRELTNVEPPLRFSCDSRDWVAINDLVGEFWWKVRYYRACAWDNDFGGLIKADHIMQLYADELVTRLTPFGVDEQATRTWLATYREKVDQHYRELLDRKEQADGEWLYELPVFRLTGS
jgi:hypothetical protein